MKILITGHLGFVGQETVKLLQENAIETIGYDIMEGNDIRDKERLDDFVDEHEPDRILHLAAIARFSEADDNPIRAHSTNVTGTANVSEVAEAYRVPLVYASTGSVYMPIQEEPPITEVFPVRGNSVYGVTKALGEYYIQQSSNPYIILRYGHLYGKEKRYHGLIGGFLSRIERGVAPKLYGGKQSNDFIYIKDVAQANLRALTASWDRYNQAYNIGTGEELSAERAGQAVCDITGYKGDIERVEQRTVDPSRFVYDTTKAENMLEFNPQYDFKAGLKDMFTAQY